VWHRYAQGLVEEVEQLPLDEHLGYCSACLGLLAKVTGEDALQQVLRRGMTLHDDAAVAVEMARLKQLARQIAAQEGSSASADTPSGMGSESVTRHIRGEVTPADGLPARINELLSPPQQDGELGRLGEFRVLRVLGQGGMGVVLLAEDIRLARRVALKVLQPNYAREPAAVSRFLREARAMALLEHDHVASVYQAGEVGGVVYLAMELLDGETLEARLMQGPLPVPQVLRIGREAALGLAAAHEAGLIHRDVKPDNIFLQRICDGPIVSYRVKLLDFGLARALHGDKDLTTPGTVVGTPTYMAPEQADGLAIDTRADLFGLGAVLYRLCTGRLPFQGATLMATLKAVAVSDPVPIQRLQPGVPVALVALINRLLDKDPAGRPGSAREVAEALADIERQKPRSAAPRHSARRPRWLLVPAVLTGVLAASLIVGLLLKLRDQEGRTRDDLTALAAPTPSPIVHDLSWEGEEEHIYLSALSPDGRWALAGSGFRGKVWEVASGKMVAELPGGVGLFTPDSKYLLLAVPPRSTVVYDLTWKPVHTFDAPHKPSTLALSGASRFLVGGNGEDAVRLWDLKTTKELLGVDEKRGHWVAISANGGRIAAMDHPGKELRLWDTRSGTRLRTWKPSVKEPMGLWFQDDGQVMLASEQELTWWKDDADRPVRRLPLATDKVASLGVSVRGGLVVFGVVGKKEVQVWSLTSGKELGRVPLPYSTYGEIGLTPDGRLGSLAVSWRQRVVVFRLPEAAVAHAGATEEEQSWVRRVAGLPPAEQVKQVAARLRQFNPDFDGTVWPVIEGDAVTGLEFSTKNVTNLSGLGVLSRLRRLTCAGSVDAPGRLTDLAPLRGLSLESLDLQSNPGLSDLGPLTGMPLEKLNLNGTHVEDLSPLKRMPLVSLKCRGTRVRDLAPLRRSPLSALNVSNCRLLQNLQPLKGVPLRILMADVSCLESNRQLLEAMPKLKAINGKAAQQFWKEHDERATPNRQ
jgi:serine/threonine protein kinase